MYSSFERFSENCWRTLLAVIKAFTGHLLKSVWLLLVHSKLVDQGTGERLETLFLSDSVDTGRDVNRLRSGNYNSWVFYLWCKKR